MKKLFILPVLLLACLASCEHKDLCYLHWHDSTRFPHVVKASYEQNWEYTSTEGIDWEKVWNAEKFGMEYDDLRPGIPSGLCMTLFPANTLFSDLNITADSCCVGLPYGKTGLLFYNNDTERIVFDGMSDPSTAIAQTRSSVRGSYMGSPFTREDSDEPEVTVNEPDILYSYYIASHNVNSTSTTDTVDLYVKMRPVVYRYLVRYYFKHGLQYVGKACGAIAGLAKYVRLTDRSTSSEVVTVLYDAKVRDNCVEAVVNSFGAPGYTGGYYIKPDDKCGLNLEVQLRNGKVLTFDFDITEQVYMQPRGGVIEVDGIEISDADGAPGSSGFNVGVDDWNNSDDINIDSRPRI